MTIDANNPKLTAYVLGELDAGERAQIDRLLEQDAEARLEVDEIRSTAAQLAGALQAERAPALTADQRRLIGQAAAARCMAASPWKLRRVWAGLALAAAACLTVVLAVPGTLVDRAERERASGLALNTYKEDADRLGLRGESRSREKSRVMEQAPAIQLGEALALGRDANEAGQPGGIPYVESPEESARRAGLELFGSELRLTLPADAITGGALNADAAGDSSILRALVVEPAAPAAPTAAPAAPSSTGVPALSRIPSTGTFAAGGGGGRGRLNQSAAGGGAPQPAGGGAAGYVVIVPPDKSVEATYRFLVDELRSRQVAPGQPGAENYAAIVDNPFLPAREHPLSTFSIDVDTASYSNTRRFLTQGSLPPPDAVRIEELLNYFRYDYAPPAAGSPDPFAAHIEVGPCAWQPAHRLVRVGLKGREVAMDQRPATNLVFLIDVSGSMQPENKLPLLKESMKLLVDQLHGDDRLAIVVYAGAAGLVLPSTYCSEKATILSAIDQCQAGGSTAGAAGIQLAYDVAQQHFIKGGINRVVLATDGDFNVGVSDEGGLLRLIEEKRAGGVSLSVLGFGEGNLQDAKMELLADKGNGNYAYIDSIREGRKVLVEEASGTLITIAKDVKIQVEFNPAEVSAYRLIGYENRVLAAQDFNDDRKDAGEIGAGHEVTALYEFVPVGKPMPGVAPPVDPLKYQPAPQPAPSDAPAPAPPAAFSGELLTLKLRYKQPDGDESTLIQFAVKDDEPSPARPASRDFQFASAVAAFGMIIRDSPHRAAATFALALDLAQGGKGADEEGYRAEFISLIEKARALRGEVTACP